MVNGQKGGGALPIDHGWGLEVGLADLVFDCFVCLQKKIILNFVMEQNKEQRQIKLLKILAKVARSILLIELLGKLLNDVKSL